MKFINIIRDIVLLEYSEKLVSNLVDRYSEMNPDVSKETIRYYIKRFKEIKDSPNVIEKDITKYSWNDLEKTIDRNEKKKIKVGKFDVTATDSNLIYNEGGIRLYKSNTLESCVKYGNGYSFCISSRGLKNMYHEYRMIKGGTIYFVFNDNITNKMYDNGDFIDPSHVLVIIVYKNHFTITDATNKQEEMFTNVDDMITKYHWLEPIVDYLTPIKTSNFETEISNLKKEYNREKQNIENLIQDNPNNSDLKVKLDNLTYKFRSDVNKLRIEFNKN